MIRASKLEINNFDFDKILLRHFVFLNDAEKEMVRNWRNNKNIRKWFLHSAPITRKEHNHFIQNLKTDERNGHWLVVIKPDTPAGVVYLNRISIDESEAHLGLYANPERHIPGAGDILMGSILKLAFENLKLNTLRLSVLKDNLRAIRLYERWNFITNQTIINKTRSDAVFQDRLLTMSFKK